MNTQTFVDYNTHRQALEELAMEFSNRSSSEVHHQFFRKPDFTSWTTTEFRFFSAATRKTDSESWSLSYGGEAISRFRWFGEPWNCDDFVNLAERGRRILDGMKSLDADASVPHDFALTAERIDWLSLLHDHGRHCPTLELQASLPWWNPEGLPLSEMTNQEVVAFRQSHSEMAEGSFPAHPLCSKLRHDVFRASAGLVSVMLDDPLVTQVDVWEAGYATILLPDCNDEQQQWTDETNSALAWEDIEIIEDEFTFRVAEKSVFLGNTIPFRLLACLCERPGRYVSFAELGERAWYEELVDRNTVKGTQMDKRVFTDDSGKWFDADESELLGTMTAENGSASLEESVLFTSDGRYALERIVFDRGDQQRDCELIVAHDAALWLNKHDFDVPEHLQPYLKQV